MTIHIKDAATYAGLAKIEKQKKELVEEMVALLARLEGLGYEADEWGASGVEDQMKEFSEITLGAIDEHVTPAFEQVTDAFKGGDEYDPQTFQGAE